MRRLIGKGQFTRCYQTGEKTVEVVTSCPTKECYSMFSGGNSFAPSVERDYDKPNTFKMPLYPKMKSPKKQLNERSQIVYRELRRLGLGLNYFQFCDKVNAISALNEEEKEEITSLAGDVCNAIDPQDMRFEISPRNVSFNENGHLIMLDCFFSLKVLKAQSPFAVF